MIRGLEGWMSFGVGRCRLVLLFSQSCLMVRFGVETSNYAVTYGGSGAFNHLYRDKRNVLKELIEKSGG